MPIQLSKLADNITTSPILTFAAAVNKRIASGDNLYNLTVGDFNPKIYPIPEKLKNEIILAYKAGQTNYPGAFGIEKLRISVAKLLKNYCNVNLSINNILIASGSRPLIYATFKAIIDKGDTVLFPVPSWNNDYYSLLSGAKAVMVETTVENNFMPTKTELMPFITDATILALCSPQNPTGTVFSKQQLNDICDLVVAENNRRGANKKPLYIMFDQVYWLMVFGDGKFYHAQSLNQEINKYAIFIDGISKSFAATGVRVGWASGPTNIIAKMRSFIAHIGAWAPKAEQIATGEFLTDLAAVDSYLQEFRLTLQTILTKFYNGFIMMKQEGLPVDSIKPQASIYLSIKLDLIGKKTINNKVLNNVDDVQDFLLNDAKVAVLPFSWFGAKNCNSWYRISVGTCKLDEVDDIVKNIKTTLKSIC